jgi:integrase
MIRKSGWPTAIKTFRTKRDAEDWARRTEDEMVRGVYIDRADAGRMLLKTAIDRYLCEVSSTKKPSTASAEKHKAKALKAELGDYSLAALNPTLVAEYRDLRLADGKSPDTVRLELSLLSHVFTIAIKEWRLGLVYNPVMNIRKPAPGAGRNRRLSADEESKLLKACDNYSNPMLGWIVRTGLYTGMRAGEITTLRRSQVDLKRRVVRLSNTKNGTDRTVPLGKEATQVLTAALDHPIRPVDTDMIFWGEPGRDKKRRPYEFRMAWKKIIKDTEIKNLRFHDLRHEAVSRLVEIGLGDQEIAAISGHKSMQMLKRYTHLRAEDLVERLDQLRGLS